MIGALGSTTGAPGVRMFRIIIANAKGGCGKTTLATNLAAFFAGQGRRSVIVDCDPQGSSAAWGQERPATVPPVGVVRGGDAQGLAAGWSLRIPAGTEYLVVDTPAGFRDNQLVQLTRLAQVMLVPVLPSALDLRATLAFLESVRRIPEVRSGALRIGVVANRVRDRTLAARELAVALAGLEQPQLVRLRDSQRYVQLAAAGLSVFDAKRDVEAHRSDWVPLLGWLLRRSGSASTSARAERPVAV